MSRRDPYRKRLQVLLNSEALKTIEEIRTAKETGKGTLEEVRSTMSTYAPGGRADKLMKLRAALDPEEQALLILRVDKGLAWEDVAEVLRADGEPVALAALRMRFEQLKEKLKRLAREQGLIE
jgi:RNA polymerase sigma-70 factor, ECF subfamily